MSQKAVVLQTNNRCALFDVFLKPQVLDIFVCCFLKNCYKYKYYITQELFLHHHLFVIWKNENYEMCSWKSMILFWFEVRRTQNMFSVEFCFRWPRLTPLIFWCIFKTPSTHLNLQESFYFRVENHFHFKGYCHSLCFLPFFRFFFNAKKLIYILSAFSFSTLHACW